MNRRLTRTAAALAAALALFAPALLAAEGSFDRTLTVSGKVLLDVETGSGRINVVAGQEGQVRIRGEVRARRSWLGLTSGWAEVEEIEKNPPIEQDGNTIRVGHISERRLRRRVSINYTLEVPESTEIRATSGSGGIELDSVRGGTRARTGSGRITAKNVGGGFEARTGSGRVTVETSRVGPVVIETGSGRVRLECAEGHVRAVTGSGSIYAEGNPSDDWYLRTGSGRITIRLPMEAAFDLYARSGSGSLTSDHPVTVRGRTNRHLLEGKVRGGGPRVELRTGSGSIRIE